jgi:O-antigen/teichoic acid export membrane protein
MSRSRRARVASISALFARSVAIGVSFAIIPMTQGYLGPERFGLWVTITSFVTLLSFADLGIGNTLLSSVSRAQSLGDNVKVNEIISTAAFVLISLGVAVAIAGAWVVNTMDISAVFNVTEPSVHSELLQTLRVFALMFGLNIAVNWISRVQMALQRGYLESVSTVLGALFGLCWVSFSINNSFVLPSLLAGFLAGPILSVTLVGIYFFLKEFRIFLPRLSSINRSSAHSILKGGLLFVGLQASGAAAFASDSFIITAQLGPIEAGDFAIVAKLYGAILILVNIYVAPLWPAYAEAHAKKDHAWMNKTVRKSFVICAIGSATAGVILTMSYGMVTSMWLGASHGVSISLLITMVVWTSLVSTGAAGSMFLNGLQIYRFQLGCALSFIVLMLPAKWLLVPMWGTEAIPVIGAVAFFMTHLLPYGWFIPQHLKESK